MIEFKKTNLDKLNDYLELYKRSFKKFEKNFEYLKWQYIKNPHGNFVGIDCYDNNTLIGQVGGIPKEFIFNNRRIKSLISINVCVDPSYKGKGIFKKMAIQFEQIAKNLNFDLIIAIANKAATIPWQKSIGLNKLNALDVFVGFGKLENDKVIETNYNFYSLWNMETLEWRMKNPINETFFQKIKNNQSVYSKSNFTLIDAYSPMVFLEDKIDKNTFKKKIYRPIVYVGLINDFKKTNLLFNLPEFLKPSPLNFLYKFTKSNDVLDPKKVFFTFLDFDAF